MAFQNHREHSVEMLHMAHEWSAALAGCSQLGSNLRVLTHMTTKYSVSMQIISLYPGEVSQTGLCGDMFIH